MSTNSKLLGVFVMKSAELIEARLKKVAEFYQRVIRTVCNASLSKSFVRPAHDKTRGTKILFLFVGDLTLTIHYSH